MEDRSGGAYGGSDADAVRKAAIALTAAAEVLYNDPEQARALLFPDLAGNIVAGAQKWGPWHRRQFGAFSHVAGYSCVAEETAGGRKPIVVLLDVVFRGASADAGAPRTSAWGGHCTWKGWFCVGGERDTGGEITGLGPHRNHGDGVPLPGRTSPALPWRLQKLRTLWRALQALVNNDEGVLGALILDPIREHHTHTLWTTTQERFGTFVGFATDSMQWKDLDPTDASLVWEVEADVVAVPPSQDPGSAYAHRVHVEAALTKGNVVNGLRSGWPKGDDGRLPLPKLVGGRELLGGDTVSTDSRVVLLHKTRTEVTHSATVKAGERVLVSFVLPQAGHPMCRAVEETQYLVDGEPAEPDAVLEAGWDLAEHGETSMLCDGHDTVAQRHVAVIRVDNSAGSKDVVVTRRLRAVVGRRRVVDAERAERLPDGSVVPCQSLTPRELRSMLRADDTLDYNDPAFQAWLDDNGLRRSEGEPAIAYLRRAQAFLANNFVYAGQRHVIESASTLAADSSPYQMHCHSCTLSLLSILCANRVPCRGMAGSHPRRRRGAPAPTVSKGAPHQPCAVRPHVERGVRAGAGAHRRRRAN